MIEINLNDSQYDLKTVKIFNGGVAGVVNGCKIRVERKKSSDAENAPKYKVLLTDSTGGEINKGYFVMKDEASDGQKTFFVKEMKHYANLFDVKMPATISSYEALLDVVMKGVNDNSDGKLINTVVSYGTKSNPKKYLEIGSGFDIVGQGETPYLNPKYQMTRIDPSAVSLEPQAGDLPFDAPSGTAANAGW